MCLSTVSLPSSLPAGLELRSRCSCSELELSERTTILSTVAWGLLSALWGGGLSHLVAELHLCEEPKFVLVGGPVGA